MITYIVKKAKKFGAIMDLLAESAELGLGSRLKRLSDRLYAEVEIVYAARGIKLNPRAFPLFFVLRQKEQVGIVELAAALGVTHAAISVMVKKAKADGLVSVVVPESDERCRLVRLTKSGLALVRKLEPTWLEIRGALKNILREEAPTFLESIKSIEAALDRNPLSARLGVVDTPDGVEIATWDPAYAAAFRDLNLEWIRTQFTVEAGDLKILDSPKKEIIDRGGMVFFARTQGMTVGTGALIPLGDGVFELAKMAVSPLMRGKGSGKKLLRFIISWAKSQGARMIYLESASGLTAALKMYRSMGFKDCEPLHKTAFDRVDTYMSKQL